jgi:predicted HicB family RNase H-like nuclease
MKKSSTRKNFTVRVKTDLQKAIRHQAVDEERDLSDLVEDALDLYLQTKTQSAA